MKPARFLYHRPQAVAEAVELLGAHGDEASVLAGGQSLLAMMNFRLARPSHLVDIGRIEALRGLEISDAGLHIGALTTHYDVEFFRSPAFDRDFAVLRDAMQWVGHLPIRTRGTVGGSIAHADPTAEWCLLAVLLDAEITATGPSGDRTIAAADFLLGYYTTALEPGEIVTGVVFPHPAPHAALVEFAERHGDFAVAAVAVDLTVVGGEITAGAVALAGAHPVPTRVHAAERVLAERPRSVDDGFADVAAAVVDFLDVPESSSSADELYRVRLVRALTERACRAAALAGVSS